MKVFKKILGRILNRFGYEIVPLRLLNSYDESMEKEFKAFSSAAAPYFNDVNQTIARQYAVYQSVRYIVENHIPGDIVECGVFRGGMPILMAYTLMSLGEKREIYLYDTFEGMTPPDARDKNSEGILAAEIMKKRGIEKPGDWCRVSLDDVRKNLSTTGYPMELFHFVKGDVCKTLPGIMPGPIAILRLDTDWYASTYHEMLHLYPKLVKNGVLLLDDYGNWVGSGQAVDHYFKENAIKMMLTRIDAAGRVGLRTN